MTDKEIIKVLKHCTTDGYCITCPYNNCTDKDINELALDLINRQQAEIERFKKQKEISNSELAKAINKSLEQAKEIGNIKDELIKERS